MQGNFIDKWTSEEFENINISSFCDKSVLSYKKINNAIIYPAISTKIEDTYQVLGGVGTSEGVFIDGTHLSSGVGGIYQCENIQFKDITAVYLGFFYHIWGHVITDNFKFLWYIYSNDFKKLQETKNVKLIYISERDLETYKNIKELFSMADIDYLKLERVENVTQFKEIIIPDACFFRKGSYRYYTSAYQNIIERIMSKVETIEIGKVYLTRTKLKDKRDFGEKDLEKAFKKNGYKIIAPEKLSLKQQLSIYKSAKEIAVTEGSISHNAVFMNNETSLILLKKANFINTYQLAINDMKQLKVTYIDAHLSCFVNIDSPWLGPFYMYCNDHVSSFLGCNKRFKIFQYIMYILKCFSLKDIERRILSNGGLYHKMRFEISEILSSKQKISMLIKILFKINKN